MHDLPMRETQSIALDGLLQFAEPSTCEPAAAHARLLSMMIAGDANEGFRPGIIDAPSEFRQAFEAPAVKRYRSYWTIGSATQATLFGIPLIRIVQALPEGGDPGDVTYVFRTRVEVAEQVLRARGFPVRAGRDVPVGPVDLQQFGIGLRQDPRRAGQTLLTCGVL